MCSILSLVHFGLPDNSRIPVENVWTKQDQFFYFFMVETDFQNLRLINGRITTIFGNFFQIYPFLGCSGVAILYKDTLYSWNKFLNHKWFSRYVNSAFEWFVSLPYFFPNQMYDLLLNKIVHPSKLFKYFSF